MSGARRCVARAIDTLLLSDLDPCMARTIRAASPRATIPVASGA
jgi:hypothetical protein